MDSPKNLFKNLEKNIEGFFSSPDSPSFLPKIRQRKKTLLQSKTTIKPLATKNLGTLFNSENPSNTSEFDSPTSTLAADLSQNFHIQDDKSAVSVIHSRHPLIPKKNINFSSLDFNSPLISRNASSSTTNSISSTFSSTSQASLVSVSSVDSTASNNTIVIAKNKRTFTRTNSSFIPNLHSHSVSNIDFKSLLSDTSTEIREQTLLEEDLNNDDDNLDSLFFASPIKQFSKRELNSPLHQKPMKSKVRRTHSMFYSQSEILTENNKFDMKSSPSNLRNSKIDYYYDKNDFIPRINVDTLCQIIDGKFNDFFHKITIVDCRFEYEYQGGHIMGSVNVSSQQDLEKMFLNNNLEIREKLSESELNEMKAQRNKHKNLIIFHCEFSSYRGPLMANHLRTCDRYKNQNNYPYLDYPDILILEGGYKNFFTLKSTRCIPQKYIEMNDNKYLQKCEIELDRFTRELKRTSSINSIKLSNQTMNKKKIGLSRSSTAIGTINFNSKRLFNDSVSTNTGTKMFDSERHFASNHKDTPVPNRKLTGDETHVKIDIKDKNLSERPPQCLDFGFKFPPLPIKSANSVPFSSNNNTIGDDINNENTKNDKRCLTRSATLI